MITLIFTAISIYTVVPSLAEKVILTNDENACPITTFIPFNRGLSPSKKFNGNRAFSQMAAFLLAVEDFNTRNGSVVPELESDALYKDCPIYIPMERLTVVDSEASSSAVPKYLLDSRENPPCAIVGPYMNERTWQSSVLADAMGVPVISHGADDPRLSGEDHKMVFRSVTDVDAIGEAIVRFIRLKGRTDFLGGLYVSQDFGILSQEAILNAAKGSGFNRFQIRKISPSFVGDRQSVSNAVRDLKASTFRTLFIALSDDLSILSEIADAIEENEMNGGDYVWVISVPNIVELDEINAEAHNNINVTKLLNGAGLVRLVEGFDYNPVMGRTDPFLQHWKNQNASFVHRVNEKNPLTPEDTNYFMASTSYFRKQFPLQGSAFIYDAVMMAGMGKCQEHAEKQSRAHFPSEGSHDLWYSSSDEEKTNFFVKGIQSLKFTGATGTVEMSEESGIRNKNTLHYGIYNFVELHNIIHYRLTDLMHPLDNCVETQSKYGPFIFANGLSAPSPLLRDVPEQNTLSPSTQYVGLLMMSACVFFNVMSAIFVFRYWNRDTFREAHPRMLLVLLMGLTCVALSILGFSFDESYGWSENALDYMCKSFPWLLGTGYLTIYTCLLCKLLMFKQQTQKDKWDRPLNIFSTFLVFTTFLVFFTWLANEPRHWDRIVMNPETGESVGYCVSSDIQSFNNTLGTLMGTILVFTIYISYGLKDIDKQFADSCCIFVSSFTESQVLFIGMPILWQLSFSSSTDSLYLGRAIMICIICLIKSVCLFGKKIYMVIFPDEVSKIADSVWKVKLSELDFGYPVEIIGRGTFGYVLKAEYRGTAVAVKRVIPPRTLRPQGKRYRLSSLFGHVDESIIMGDAALHKEDDSDELGKRSSGSATCGTFPLSSSSLSSWTGSSFSLVSKSRKEYSLLMADFILEMRSLSKLRHPCITTVMGAVINRNEEPMLIMELMEYGSLHDLLHNDTMVLEGEILLPILRDITQGMRFLHAADPQVIHGDLKAANILVDSKFRAKVADFGLSQKRQVGATGTPFWMAPELLNFDTFNTSASDMYSFGIVLYEMYSRKDPYHGEDFNEVLKMVADPDVCKRPRVPKTCPEYIRTMMSDCLRHDPNKRPTFADLDVLLRNLDSNTVEPAHFLSSFQEQKRTDQLLYDVFPQHIAQALLDGRKVDPEFREIVTIFFSDIVGFEDITSTLEPIKVSHMLERLYKRFDEVSQKHDVFKVETIGDAYMAVTNLVKEQPDHAKIMANFSIDLIEAANETQIDIDDVEKGYINIRVGLHSGPVVANVIGSRNPRYCLFGDTVNTASRMESYSKKNRIHCSERAAQLLRNQDHNMPLEPRGEIVVKGKGKMRTFWVNEGDQYCLRNDAIVAITIEM